MQIISSNLFKRDRASDVESNSKIFASSFRTLHSLQPNSQICRGPPQARTPSVLCAGMKEHIFRIMRAKYDHYCRVHEHEV